MAGAREIVIKIIGDASKLQSAVDETNNKLSGLGRATKIAGAAFAGGVVADQVIDFLGDSTKAAEEDKKSQALLANQLKTTMHATDAQVDSVEDYIGTLSRATGVADDDLRPAYMALARASGDTETAQSELSIAMDIAAAKGVDLATVTGAMEKAHQGNIGALGRLGIATKDAEGNTLSLEDAMAGAKSTFEGAAEAAVTPSQRMQIAWNELQEQIGTILLPVLENLSTFMADTLLPAFQNAIEWVQEHWPEIEKAIKDTFDKIKPWVDEFIHSIELAFNIIAGVFKTFNSLLHGDFSQAWENFKNLIGDVWEGIKNLVGDKIEQVKTLFGGLVTWISQLPGKIASAAGDLFIGVVAAARTAFNKVIDFFNDLLEHIGLHIHIDPPGPGSINFDWDAPKVPHLAKGGIVTSPTLALIGEAGPEAVIPLGRGGGMGGVNIYGPVYLTAQTDSELVQQLSRIGRRAGGVPISGGVRAVS